jgi:hypothetical protein
VEKMALSNAAWSAERAIGHDENAATMQDVSNPDLRAEYGDPSVKMKALVWMGKNVVQVGKFGPLTDLCRKCSLFD